MPSPDPVEGSAVSPVDEEEVINLHCPVCLGILNLRRKHLGLKGNCVHCQIPVIAQNADGKIRLKRLDATHAAEPVIRHEEEVEKPPAEDMKLGQLPEDLRTALESASEEESESSWGFPKRNESEVEEIAKAEVAPHVPDAPGADGSASGEPVLELGPEENISTPDREETLQSNFLDESAAIPAAASALFGDRSVEKPPAPEETADEKEVADLDPEPEPEPEAATQNHASISPFSTGSASGEPGFAETLFSEDGDDASPHVEPKSPFIESPGNTGALFAQPSEPEPAVSEEPVVLDGDGRPMAPMTEEEKEAFANEMMQVGEFHKRSPWISRIVKFLVTLVVLGGIGYACYVFMPEDMVDDAKAKVYEWLEPGSVLMDFLPFELEDVQEGEGGEKGEKRIKIKAIDGLNNLTNEMDSYLDASDQNLRESGFAVPEREKKEEMEMPDIPNIPKMPFKLPQRPASPDTE